jgi:hypothetical protein
MDNEREGNEQAAGRHKRIPGPAKVKRHEVRCGICHHPQRAELEREFLDWASPREIVAEYKVSKTALYRHAEATGLIERRRNNRGIALERMIERAGDTKVTAAAVISAIRLLVKMGTSGRI